MTPEENLARITEEVNEQMRRFGHILPETNQRLLEAQTGIQNFGFKTQVATNIMGNLVDVVGNYTSAMYRGEKGAAAFNSSIDSMTNAAQTAVVGLSLLVPGGALVKGVVAGLTFLATSFIKNSAELTKTANDQNDNLYRAFSQMADVGAVGADGMEGLFSDIQKLGLNVNKLDHYIGLTTHNANELSLMGGTVLKGRKQFADLGLAMAGQEESLRKLGLNEDEQAAALLYYAKTQNRLTQGSIKDFGALSGSAYKFILEQDALTKVTGLSRKQQQDAMDEALRNERFLAASNKITRKFGQDSDAVKQVASLVTITKSIGERTYKGFQDMLGGRLDSKESTDLLQSSPELYQLIQKLNAGGFEGNQQGFEAQVQKALEGMSRSAKMNEELALSNKSFGVGYVEMNKADMMAKKNFVEMTAAAKEEQKNQLGDKGNALANQAALLTEQNKSMLVFQDFISTGAPDIFKNNMQAVTTELLKFINDKRALLGSGPIVGKNPERTGGYFQDNQNSFVTGTDLTMYRQGNPNSRPGPVGPNNPPVQRPADTLPPWSQQNPLPVVIQPPVPPDLRSPPSEQPQPQPRTPPRMNDPLFPPRVERTHGTSGELGSLFEPKDIIAQLHKGERVLNKDENSDLTKLFNMVSGEKTQKKMMDAQGEMLKVIDSITNGMKLTNNSGGNKDFGAARAEMSLDTGPTAQSSIDFQGEMLKQIALIRSDVAPTARLSNQSALLGNMPTLEINKEAAEQIGQTLKDNMGDEFKSAVSSINRFAEQMQSRDNAGLQQQMVTLLEEIRRAQTVTATASQRLAQVASN